MLKIASLIWIMLATTLGGIAVTAILATPSLSEQAAVLIPAVFIAGAVVAAPISYLIARKIGATRA